MEKIFFANFKMNFDLKEIKDYFEQFLKVVKIDKNCIGFFLPYTFLKQTKEILKKTKILVGAQNVHHKEKGAYTGEISTLMLKSCGVDIVLVGHSERRNLFKETDNEINQKIKNLMKHNIKVVLCVGEKKGERMSGATEKVIFNQLKAGLSGLYENEFENLVIAYEPIWSIGTGEIPSNRTICESVLQIRNAIKDLYNKTVSEKIPVIYGGSVSAKNFKTLARIKNINGFLVGGASLNPDEFAEIING